MKRIPAVITTVIASILVLSSCSGSNTAYLLWQQESATPQADLSTSSETQAQVEISPADAPPLSGVPATAYSAGSSPAQEDDWLSTDGNAIIDSGGSEVWVTGVSWFGYNTGTNAFDGLWAANLEDSLQGIADRGFNLLRVPFSAELILRWSQGDYPPANCNFSVNRELEGKNSLEIFDYALSVCSRIGIKVMITIQSVKSDPTGHTYPLWYDGDISEEDYLSALEWMAERYRLDDTILAYDLKNEPHGSPQDGNFAVWNGSEVPNNWRNAARKAALRVLKANPNALVVVEGVEAYPKDIKGNGDYSSSNSGDYYYNWWGGNLRGVADFPLELGEHSDKLVYSPHDYGPSVYAQPWFREGYTFETLYADCWKDNWMFIHEKEIAPLLIGEWGGTLSQSDLRWMTCLRELIEKNRLGHVFWCYNANSGDTGGLVQDDFSTWDEEKYAFVKSVLWQEGGRFVGLDHAVALGANGKALGGP